MGQRLADAAVRGRSNTLLEQGDIDELIALHREIFGEFTMKDEDDADDKDDDADDSDDGDDSDDDDDSDDADDDDKKSDPKDKRIQELSGEAKRYRLKNREHRNRIAELERELKGKAKPKAKDDEDENDSKTSEELEAAKGDNEKLAHTNEDLLIRLEFMGNTKHSWKNPKAALRLLDLSDVEVTDDGDVEGLDEAIEALAKSDPYLLGKDEEDDEDDERPKRKRTGQPTGQRKRGNPNRDKLVSKYPALRR